MFCLIAGIVDFKPWIQQGAPFDCCPWRVWKTLRWPGWACWPLPNGEHKSKPTHTDKQTRTHSDKQIYTHTREKTHIRHSRLSKLLDFHPCPLAQSLPGKREKMIDNNKLTVFYRKTPKYWNISDWYLNYHWSGMSPSALRVRVCYQLLKKGLAIEGKGLFSIKWELVVFNQVRSFKR